MTVLADSERLTRLREYHLLDSAPEPEFDAIVCTAAAHAGVPISTISLIDYNRAWFKASIGMDVAEMPLEASICAVAMRSDEVFVVPDASCDARFQDMPGVADGIRIRFYAGAPLRTRDGVSLGVLCVIDVEARDALEADERRMLETLARRTVAAFELRRDMIADRDTLTQAAWLEEASELLNRASVALERAGLGTAVAHLDHVIAMVDAHDPA